MNEKFKILEQVLGRERVKLDEPLKYHFAGGIDAKAECFYIATSVPELIKALDLAKDLNIPFFVFGGGTKIMFASEELKGLIIKNCASGVRINGVKGKVSSKGIGVEEAMVEAESGVSMNKLNEFLKAQGLKELDSSVIGEATIGGSLSLDPRLQFASQKTKVWSDSEVSDIDILELKRTDIILSTVLKIKSAS
jgi:UDP-N-acetylmuramate dehydrogenase